MPCPLGAYILTKETGIKQLNAQLITILVCGMCWEAQISELWDCGIRLENILEGLLEEEKCGLML